jgi:hypothetical protein
VYCRLKVEKPEAIEYTLTVTMKASEWETLREQLEEQPGGARSYPAYTLVREIDDLLAQARKVYWPSAAVINEASKD